MKCGDTEQCEKSKNKGKIQGASFNSKKPQGTPWNPMKPQGTPMVHQ